MNGMSTRWKIVEQEADVCNVTHVYRGILHGYKQIIVTSTNTDVFALIRV